MATDTCLSGCGAWFETKREFFHAEFPEEIKKRQLSINALELLTVVVAAKVWGKKWHGMRIVIRFDNETSLTLLNTGRAYNVFLLECLRELEFVAAICEFEMQAVHIPGVENQIPDALSRWDLGEEHRLWFKEVTKGGPKGPKDRCLPRLIWICAWMVGLWPEWNWFCFLQKSCGSYEKNWRRPRRKPSREGQPKT